MPGLPLECLRNFLRNQFGSQAVTEGEQIIRRLFERRKQMGETWWRSQIDACCRQMALKHHPDRVATLGEDVRKAAEKKFQEINDAKDRIYKARGIKK